MTTIFEETKRRLTLEAVMRFYGVEPPRHGNISCPFHEDKNPSFSVKGEHFKCFSCGVGGDVIEFARLINNLEKPIDAVNRLRSDFGMSTYKAPDKSVLIKREQERSDNEAFKEWERNAFLDVSKYFREVLPARVKEYRNVHEKLGSLFQNMATEEHILDELTFGTWEDKIKVFVYQREVVKSISERVRNFERERTKRTEADK